MKELLVPAGNMECLKHAVYNGADAVYFACKKYGARAFAQNFTDDEVVEAISFAHLYGVKVYITMNTLVKNSEVESFMEQVDFLYRNGVDALLIQDFGMMMLVHETYPNLSIHASTQFHATTVEEIQFLHDIGVERVVLPREMSLSDISKISAPIELEVFIHGALCISYSGYCLMSSSIGNRSGNRGECTGCCRLSYSLFDYDKKIKEGYCLSNKELNTSSRFSELLHSNITSFKIEGRMKSPEYVGFITRFYRRIIDGTMVDYGQELEKLKILYNRDFTLGHLFASDPASMIRAISSNHVGLPIGKVVNIDSKYIKIQLNKKLTQGDAIRFSKSNTGFVVNYLYDSKKKLVSDSDNICYVEHKVDVQNQEEVYLTKSILLSDEIFHYKPKKIPIKIHLIVQKNSPMLLEFSDYEHSVLCKGAIVEESRTLSMSEESCRKQILRLNDTPFYCQAFSADIDDHSFVSIQNLNQLRRNCVSELVSIRQSRNIHYQQKIPIFSTYHSSFSGKTIACSVYTEEQLLACLEEKVDFIYIHQEKLYCRYKNQFSNLYYVESPVTTSPLSHHKLVSHYRDYSKFHHIIGNYGLNIYNIYTFYYLQKFGLMHGTFSPELNPIEIKTFFQLFYQKFHYYPDIDVLLYGRVENMIIKGNIFHLSSDLFRYSLKDQHHRKFPIYFQDGYTHILNYETKVILNLTSFPCRIDFYDENFSKVKEIINNIRLNS